MSDLFWLKIKGEPGDIDAAALHRGISALLMILKTVGTNDFVVTDMRLNSLEIGIAPRADVSQSEFEQIVSHLSDLGRQSIPDAVGPELLDGVVDLSAILDLRGVDGIEVGSESFGIADIDETVRATAQAALTSTTVAHGSVRGRIHRFLDHKNKREVSLVDQSSARTVRVTFTKATELRVLDAVNRPVMAWGELRRDRFGRKVSLRLDDFQILDQLPLNPEGSMRGALGSDWMPPELGSVESTRRQRG